MKKIEKRTYYLIPISEEFDFETLKNAGICLEFLNCQDAKHAENRVFDKHRFSKARIPDRGQPGKTFEVFIVPQFSNYVWEGFAGACTLVSETFFKEYKPA